MAEVSPVSKYVAEAVGTFALVFAVGCNVLGKAPADFAVLSIATTLAVMIYAFAAVSGGHLNPAVTFGVWLTKKDFGATEGLFYVISQCVGGLLAAGAYTAFFGHAFNLAPKAHWIEAGDAEFHYTFMLVFIVLNVACAAKNAGNEYFGFAIAFAVVAGGYAAGNVSGGVFNPAVGIAVDLVSAGKGFGWCLVYAVFQLAGAAFAALLFRVVHPEEFGNGEPSLVAKLAAEFIGTYMLVYTVGLNITAGAAPAAGALSIGAALAGMIWALGSVSGAHFNPAVTLAIVLSGRNKCTTEEACSYIATQVSAGIIAGISAGLTTNMGGSIGPIGSHHWSGVFVAESLFTFVLAFTVLTVATTQQALKHFFGLCIGFCVVVGGYASGTISGGHLNPAVSFGVNTGASIWNKASFWPCLAYTGCQAAGSVLAAGTFRLTHAVEYGKEDKYYSAP